MILLKRHSGFVWIEFIAYFERYGTYRTMYNVITICND